MLNALGSVCERAAGELLDAGQFLHPATPVNLLKLSSTYELSLWR